MQTATRLIREFLRAGKQRFTAANALFHSGLHLEAIYLAGYTIECSLKAVILQHGPKSKQGEVTEQITRGTKAHNYESLLSLLKKSGVNMPEDLVSHVRRALTLWSPDLRYQTGRKPVQEVMAMFEATRLILEWAERSTL